MSGDITRRLTLAGISAPDFLERVLECALARYMRENGYDADDSLGYVYGFHMDTAYLHIQMSVCPRTAKGVLVKVTPMVRDKGGPERVFGPGFRNPMTRYACEAAHELERELLGRDHLELRTARDMAKSLFRSHRVFAAFGDEQDRKKLYTELEDHAVTAYARESGCPAELLVELKVLLRRYAGVPDGELGAPRVDYTAPEHGPAARRLSRLWLSLAYAELENTERKMESRQSSGNAVSPPATAGTPGLPANLLPVYHAFWQRARQGAAPVQSMRNLVRQKRMVAVRDMDRELPDAARLRELFLAHKKSLGGWFENFVAWLDRHVLFGSGVYYSKLGLEELEYAVRSRVAAVPFLGGKAIGVPSKRSGESSAPAREPAIESEKTPETGPDSEEPPGRLPG
ncbi:hypothetical protein AW736_02385 [Termitidicoccus mucosus]|uniref:Uncharacterized protein n=1 Tax=Termitidicoccus mucosus TaxID=1184151 RepID=A0A178IPC8_9BACT|nr:hypothetical protein AW736_02385 [Opitutaceae bacterium TSB47]